MDRDVVIVSMARTPLGAFGGRLSSLSAVELGGAAIKAAISRAGLQGAGYLVDEVLFGNVLSANLGQAPATQAALLGGLPNSVPCTTVNKVCSSGMKAAQLAALSIQTGLNDICVVGGMESMSNAPYYVPQARTGLRIGNAELVDGMIRDGLWDPYSDIHMGQCGEMCAAKYAVSREQQDAHAKESHMRARRAQNQGWTAREIVPVSVQGPRGSPPTLVDADEGPEKFNAEKLHWLRPVFQPADGTVTAGNSSPLTDGAAALVLCSRKAAQEQGMPILAVIRSQADANQAPEWFTTSPAIAGPKAVERAGLNMADIDAWEINEAFSVVDLACSQLMQLDRSKVNMHGGAVALGHPLGASGARILVTLLNVLQVHGGKLGCAVICNGGGGASSMVIERSDSGQPGPRL